MSAVMRMFFHLEQIVEAVEVTLSLSRARLSVSFPRTCNSLTREQS